MRQRSIRDEVDRTGRRCFLTMTNVMAIFGPLLLSLSLSPEEQDTAVIMGSGSTNTAGFRIRVERSGLAEYTSAPRKYGAQRGDKPNTKRQQLSRDLADRFYSDLEAAKPISSLPEQRCMKSASFGSTLVIEFGGQRTPDLSCGDGGNAKLQALIRDVNEITKLFGPTEMGSPAVEPK